MKHRLTHELLTYLKAEGYTMLVGLEKAAKELYVFTPVQWNVSEFLENLHTASYNEYPIHIIDELLQVDLKQLFTHRVILPDAH